MSNLVSRVVLIALAGPNDTWSVKTRLQLANLFVNRGIFDPPLYQEKRRIRTCSLDQTTEERRRKKKATFLEENPIRVHRQSPTVR